MLRERQVPALMFTKVSIVQFNSKECLLSNQNHLIGATVIVVSDTEPSIVCDGDMRDCGIQCDCKLANMLRTR